MAISYIKLHFVIVQSLSHVRLFAAPWIAASQASLSFTVSWSLIKLLSFESVMLSNHLVLWCPLLLPSIFPSIRVFSNELALCIRWPVYLSFNFSISPFSEYSGLISFRIDWLDLLAVQGTLKSLLHHHSSKASILRRSAFFMIQFSHPDIVYKYWCRDLPGGPVVKNMPVNSEDVNSVPGPGTKIPHARGN